MSVFNLINSHIKNSRSDEFSIKFLCDLYKTSTETVKKAVKSMQKHREVYRVHIFDTYIKVEK